VPSAGKYFKINGVRGTSYTGDIAIDDLQLIACTAPTSAPWDSASTALAEVADDITAPAPIAVLQGFETVGFATCTVLIAVLVAVLKRKKKRARLAASKLEVRVVTPNAMSAL